MDPFQVLTSIGKTQHRPQVPAKNGSKNQGSFSISQVTTWTYQAPNVISFQQDRSSQSVVKVASNIGVGSDGPPIPQHHWSKGRQKRDVVVHCLYNLHVWFLSFLLKRLGQLYTFCWIKTARRVWEIFTRLSCPTGLVLDDVLVPAPQDEDLTTSMPRTSLGYEQPEGITTSIHQHANSKMLQKESTKINLLDSRLLGSNLWCVWFDWAFARWLPVTAPGARRNPHISQCNRAILIRVSRKPQVYMLRCW